MINKAVKILLCIILLAVVLSCTTVEDEEFQFDSSDEPVPYEEDEFYGWVNDLRRAEIIFFGSFPFSMILTNLGSGAAELIFSEGSSGYDITDFGSASAMTEKEKLQILLISGGISAGITIADYILGVISHEQINEQPAE